VLDEHDDLLGARRRLPMLRIVISYRRADSKAMAGRIHDCLVDRYGKEAVYMDVEDVPAGVDFRSHIGDAIKGAGLALAIVGQHWLGRRRAGESRIQREEDPIRAEIETILSAGIPIIPVLVDDARMPSPQELPESIRAFTYRNAVTVDAGQDFRVHMDRLTRQIDAVLPSVVARTELPRGNRARLAARRKWPIVAFPALALGAGGLVAGALYLPGDRAGGWKAPANPSYWEVDGSIVHREATGSQRRLVFARPSKEQGAGGAKPGSVFFEGVLTRRDDVASKQGYDGKVFLYFGDCDPASFEASGPELPGPEIMLTGEAPRLDMATCKKLDASATTLVVRHIGPVMPPE
jgi:hypothetical protein